MDTIDRSASSSASSTDIQDVADMKRLMSGHEAALNDLMDRHAAPIFHFLYRMVGNEDDAQDLAQETFVRVFRSCDRFRTDQRFSTWLYTIAANLARNQFRWRARHQTVSLEAAEDPAGLKSESMLSKRPGPDEAAIVDERRDAVRAAVRRLPDDLREALVLCEWEERSVVEAAAILAASPKAVESRLYRARKLLREQLKSCL